MKKVLALMLVVIMSLTLFVGCGGDDNNPDDGTIKGETYNAGNVSAFVPNGWKAFPVTDAFADDPSTIDPDGMRICKGGETEMDIFSKPYLQITYYGEDVTFFAPTKDFYDNAVDLTPFTLGELTWNGYTADSMGYPIAVIWAEKGDIQYQVNCFLGASDGTISLDDADVKAILESIK